MKSKKGAAKPFILMILRHSFFAVLLLSCIGRRGHRKFFIGYFKITGNIKN